MIQKPSVYWDSDSVCLQYGNACDANSVFYITNEMQLIQCSLLLSENQEIFIHFYTLMYKVKENKPNFPRCKNIHMKYMGL